MSDNRPELPSMRSDGTILGSDMTNEHFTRHRYWQMQGVGGWHAMPPTARPSRTSAHLWRPVSVYETVHGLIYLSHPFGGRPENLQRTLDWLVWAHRSTPWGVRVRAPWVASAMAELRWGISEQEWIDRGGYDAERRSLDGHDAILLVGSTGELQGGQLREATYMRALGRPVFRFLQPTIEDLLELTGTVDLETGQIEWTEHATHGGA